MNDKINKENSVADGQKNKTGAETSSQRSRTARGVFLTLAGGTMWGFSGTCGQYLFAVKHMDSAWLAATRMLTAGILLTLWGLSRQRTSMAGILKDKDDRKRLIVFSILGLTFCQYSYLTAIEHSNAGTATVLQYLGPVLIMIVSCVMAAKLPTKKEVLAVLLAVGGTFLLATHGNIHSLVISKTGLVWGLLSAVSLMLYTMLPKTIIGRWGSTVVTGYGMLIGGVFLFFLTGYWNRHVVFDFETVLAVAAMAVIGTTLAFTMYLQGVSDIGSVKASMLACIEPVSATVLSALWLGTAFTLMDLAGLAAIITTVFLLTKKEDGKTE